MLLRNIFLLHIHISAKNRNVCSIDFCYYLCHATIFKSNKTFLCMFYVQLIYFEVIEQKMKFLNKIFHLLYVDKNSHPQNVIKWERKIYFEHHHKINWFSNITQQAQIGGQSNRFDENEKKKIKISLYTHATACWTPIDKKSKEINSLLWLYGECVQF